MPLKDNILGNKILSGVQTTFDFLLPSPFDVSVRVNTVEYNNTTTFTEIPVDELISN